MYPVGQRGQFFGVRLGAERQDEDGGRPVVGIAFGRGGGRCRAFRAHGIGGFAVVLGRLVVAEPGERLALLAALGDEPGDRGDEVVEVVVRYAHRLALVGGFGHGYPWCEFWWVGCRGSGETGFGPAGKRV